MWCFRPAFPTTLRKACGYMSAPLISICTSVNSLDSLSVCSVNSLKNLIPNSPILCGEQSNPFWLPHSRLSLLYSTKSTADFCDARVVNFVKSTPAISRSCTLTRSRFRYLQTKFVWFNFTPDSSILLVYVSSSRFQESNPSILTSLWTLVLWSFLRDSFAWSLSSQLCRFSNLYTGITYELTSLKLACASMLMLQETIIA